MAKAYITEHISIPRSGSGHILQIPAEYGIDQAVDFTAGVTQSAAFYTTTRFIRMNVDNACSISFGSNPTATTNNRRMTAGATEFFPVFGGDKVSIITNT